MLGTFFFNHMDDMSQYIESWVEYLKPWLNADLYHKEKRFSGEDVKENKLFDMMTQQANEDGEFSVDAARKKRIAQVYEQGVPERPTTSFIHPALLEQARIANERLMQRQMRKVK